MPLSRYAKVLLLAPPIGSALIAVVGMALGIGLILHHNHASNPALAISHTTQPLRASTQPAAASTVPVALIPDRQPRPQAVTIAIREDARRSAAPSPPIQNALFQKSIPSDQLAFLSDFAGRPASESLHDPKLHQLVAAVVPYAPFHFGIDMPLPQALQGMLNVSDVPVEIRDQRYVMLTGTRGQNNNGRGRAFLWVDAHAGIALGGIFFYPSNGEPTPTLTIFSRQVNQSSLRMSQLPPAFLSDLSRWAVLEGLPPVTTRYFINASSEKTVLTHDEDYCNQADAEACAKMNADAARIDTEASAFLNRTNFASNATMRMALDPISIQVSPPAMNR